MKRKRIVSRDLAGAMAEQKRTGAPVPSALASRRVYVPKEKTPAEKLYDIIYDESVWGYRFTDTFYGIPWIELSDIEDKGNGLFVIRFRCPPEYMHKIHFGEVAEDVCERVRSGMHFFHQTREEVYSEKAKLPYEDCVWVIQENESQIANGGNYKEQEDGKSHVLNSCCLHIP